MTGTPDTATPLAAAPAPGGAPAEDDAGRARRMLARIPPAQLAGLIAVVVLASVLNIHRLAQNGYANIFYSAGIRSMLTSLHNFVFVSFDPGGLITIDKPPLALWLQAASAKLFGFSPLSLLLPEAILGVLAVAALYVILARRLGPAIAFAGAAAMAVFPSFVAISRENGVDPLLILLLVLACGAAVRACETGRWRTLIWSAALVGLAFNTKTLAALLVVPGIAAAFLICAPGSLPRRALALAVAGLVGLAVSFSWIAFVEATPASQRPYVGSSTNNTELGLTFEYNGVGRVEGQAGGPHTTHVLPGARVPAKDVVRIPGRPRARPTPPTIATVANPLPEAPPAPRHAPVHGGPRARFPVPFGGPPSPVRLFGIGLGDQGGWMLPFAFVGLLALLALVLGDPLTADAVAASGGPRASEGPEPSRPALRRDPRLATAIVLGGWFVVEAIVLSASKGIVHPYYVSALAPGTGAMVGAGAGALVLLARGHRRPWALALMAVAVLATLAVQLVLMRREHYMLWFAPLLVGGSVVALGMLVASRRLALPAIAVALALLLVVPSGYAASTWLAPVEGTFPAAGPRQAAGSSNGYGISDGHIATYRALAAFVHTHHPGTHWELLTVASDTAAPMMLLGLRAGALGGYSGTDPTLDGPRLAKLVAAGEARYVLLGGEYSLRGGNRATQAVLRACRQLAPSEWNSPVAYPYGLTLFDCAGRERELAAA